MTLFVALFSGCGGASSAPGNQPVIGSSSTVYVAGFRQNGSGIPVATLWKNGTASSLTDGSEPSFASAVAAIGDEVYVAGVVTNVQNNDVAVIWENGKSTQLTDGSLSAYVSGIAVLGSDVYVTGGQSGVTSGGTYISQSGYWLNGQFKVLLNAESNGVGGGNVSSVVVQGTDIYMAGAEEMLAAGGTTLNVISPVAVIWKNGNPSYLSTAPSYAQASSLALSGNHIYVAGTYCPQFTAGCQQSSYWQSGALMFLFEDVPGGASGIAVASGHVYISTNRTTSLGIRAEYWLDGKEFTLDEGASVAANGVLVTNNHVYIPGASTAGACYWADGQLHQLAAAGSSAFALSVEN